MAVILEATVEDFAMVNFSVDYATVDTDALIAAAQAMAEAYCERTFDYAAAAVDTVDGEGSLIQVDKWPIITVASVVENGVTLTVAQDYLIYTAEGWIRRVTGGSYDRAWRTQRQGVVITYAGGYQVDEAGAGATLPDDLKAVLSRIVGRLFRAGAPWIGATTAVGAASQVSLDGIGSVTYQAPVIGGEPVGASSSDSPTLLTEEKAALDPYMNPGLA